MAEFVLDFKHCPGCNSKCITEEADLCESCVLCFACQKGERLVYKGKRLQYCAECGCSKCLRNLRASSESDVCNRCEKRREDERVRWHERKGTRWKQGERFAAEALAGPDAEPDPNWQVDTLSADEHQDTVPEIDFGRRRVYRHLTDENISAIYDDATLNPDSEDTEYEGGEVGKGTALRDQASTAALGGGPSQSSVTSTAAERSSTNVMAISSLLCEE